MEYCQQYLGGHPKKRPLPTVKIYTIRKSDCVGEYETTENQIIIYLVNVSSYSALVRVLIHEYTHFLHMYNGKTTKQYFKTNKQVGYEHNPFELYANLNAGWFWRKIYRKINWGGAN